MKRLQFISLISFLIISPIHAIIIKNNTTDHITVLLDLEGDPLKVAVSPLESVEEYLPEGDYYISVKKAISQVKPYEYDLAIRHNDTIVVTPGVTRGQYYIDILSVDEEDLDEEITYEGVEVFDDGKPLLPEVITL